MERNADLIVSGTGRISRLVLRIADGLRARGWSDDQIYALVTEERTETADKIVEALASSRPDRDSVLVDYGKTFTELVEEARFDHSYVGINTRFIPTPIGASGKIERPVKERHLGRAVSNQEFLDELAYFVDPQTAVAYFGRHPDKRWEYPLAILFRGTGGLLWSLSMRGEARRRFLRVDRARPDESWGPDYRFLVSRPPAVGVGE